MANLIVHWHPERKERILLCAHYDTRPFPDRDPANPRGRVHRRQRRRQRRGRADGAGPQDGRPAGQAGGRLRPVRRRRAGLSGTGRLLSRLRIFRPAIRAPIRPATRYRWGVLLDMVGDADLQIFRSAAAPAGATPSRWSRRSGTRPSDWACANSSRRKGQEIRDDHLPLHNTAKIPTCDIIDFDYPAWHTAGDTADKCSALSLAKVGWVIGEWLHSAVKAD